MGDDRGPSYFDVSEYVQHIGAKYGARVSFILHPPHKAGAGARWTSWAVEVQVWRGAPERQAVRPRFEYFGAGGAWKTAPAALHAALRTLEERLELCAEAAAAQQAF